MTRSAAAPYLAIALVIGLFSLAGCQKQTRVTSTEDGVCYSLSRKKVDNSLSYHAVKTGVTQIEQCAATLEVMRRNYLSLGAGVDETMGAFQGKFIFLMHDGIYWGDTLEGSRYLALVRTQDNRLVMPGAVAR